MYSRRILLSATAGALATACAGRIPHPNLPMATRRLEVRENRLFVQVTINGQHVRALLDSGAEMTILDTDLAERLGLSNGQSVQARGTGGEAPAGLVEGVQVQALGISLRTPHVAVIDLSDVGQRLLGEPLPAILGREVFDAGRLFVNIGAGEIGWASSDVVPPGVELPLSSERGLETFPCSVEGRAPIQSVLDLGNGSDVLIGAEYARATGILTDGRAITEERGGGIGGERLRKRLVLSSLEFAGRRFENVTAVVDEADSAAALNVGVSLLRQFRIVTDFPGRTIWLAPA
jgi:predicted aspartyl protease